MLKINHWSRIGRMKRHVMPQRKLDGSASSWVPRQVSCGRLLVDTFLCSKELVRETNYELHNLVRKQLKMNIQELEEEKLP